MQYSEFLDAMVIGNIAITYLRHLTHLVQMRIDMTVYENARNHQVIL
jgi:hypothetical protein